MEEQEEIVNSIHEKWTWTDSLSKCFNVFFLQGFREEQPKEGLLRCPSWVSWVITTKKKEHYCLLPQVTYNFTLTWCQRDFRGKDTHGRRRRRSGWFIWRMDFKETIQHNSKKVIQVHFTASLTIPVCCCCYFRFRKKSIDNDSERSCLFVGQRRRRVIFLCLWSWL